MGALTLSIFMALMMFGAVVLVLWVLLKALQALCGWVVRLCRPRPPYRDPYAGPEDPFSRTNGGWDF